MPYDTMKYYFKVINNQLKNLHKNNKCGSKTCVDPPGHLF